MDRRTHWQQVYETKAADRVSWYRPHLERSLEMLARCGLSPDAHIVDVGGGASTFVDDLLDAGYRTISVVDLADAALAVSRERLGPRASAVHWIAGDITQPLLPPRSVDFWHDRAVFHFLTEPTARAAYVRQVERSLVPGGAILIATFALDGPERCSGLPVARYEADGIRAALGEGFEKIAEAAEVHQTPAGSPQSFTYCLCRRRS